MDFAWPPQECKFEAKNNSKIIFIFREFGPILAVIVFGPELAWPNWNAKFGPKIISK